MYSIVLLEEIINKRKEKKEKKEKREKTLDMHATHFLLSSSIHGFHIWRSNSNEQEMTIRRIRSIVCSAIAVIRHTHTPIHLHQVYVPY